MALGIEYRDLQNSTSIITLSGKLLLGEDYTPLAILVPQLMSNGRTNFVFDLSGVTHIDSTGIGQFIDTYTRLGKVGGQLRLACAAGAVRDSFRVTRLDTVFPFYTSVESACEGLN